MMISACFKNEWRYSSKGSEHKTKTKISIRKNVIKTATRGQEMRHAEGRKEGHGKNGRRKRFGNTKILM